MIPIDKQMDLINQVRAAIHGMSKDEKRKAQELILMGIVLALDSECPPAWKSLLMIGRAHKLFGR